MISLAALTLGAVLTLPETWPASNVDQYDVDRMARVLELRLTFPSTIGPGKTPITVYHCRRAPAGCTERTRAFAQYFVDAGKATGVPPYLLAAMALKESGLHPFASGSVGEAGILQIHPKNRDARHLRFIRDKRYREKCEKKVGACQAEVVMYAARKVAANVERCGDLEASLRAYNSGRCESRVKYPGMVRRQIARLFAIADGIDTAA